MIPTPLLAVVFDMDGLLLDTEVIYRDVFTTVCVAHGYEVPETLYRSLIGTPSDRTQDLLLDSFGPDFPLASVYADCREGLDAQFRIGVPAKPGAQELLAFLAAQGMPTAVATSTRRTAALDHLDKAGLLPHLRTVVTRDDVSNGKPHPETFVTAAARLGVAPDGCLALEDSHHGVRAAHAAGMATVMVPDLLPPTDEIAALCVAVADSLHDVHAMVTKQGAASD
jgi:HAD superfamily hydrolase (TIGR01509 family)